MDKVKIIIIGAGGRGTIYAQHIQELSCYAKVVAVAEPRDFFRNRIAAMHHIPEEKCFRDWHELLNLPKIADAVIITTQDRLHLEPAIALADMKYHILIEKPLAPDPEGCRAITDAAAKNGVIMSVCHVLRYTNFTRTMKKLIESGVLGSVMSVQHLEPVGHWRFAHSYVRGNWRKESESSSVLLAKSIHDLDWLCYIINSRPKRVSSFGSLMFFKKENQPEGAADRCLECKFAETCPYSAPKFYLGRIRSGNFGSYVESVVGDATEENMLKALKTGPYGRCVFCCDNDVADHQVVNMEFDNGATAVFTLAGCSKYGDRRTTVFGSLGELYGDGENLSFYSYQTQTTRNIPIPPFISSDHHGGGDYNLLETFVKAVLTGDTSDIVTGADVSLETHLLVFAAEISRTTGKTIEMKEMMNGNPD